jgi:murein DD-endopeptidase MepM/ murein hydrolase activator NlpD
MGFTDKHSYDDMGRGGNSRRQGNERMDKRSLRIIVSVVIVGVLLCAAVIILWLLYFSTTEPQQRRSEESLIVEPIETDKPNQSEELVTDAPISTNAPDQIATGGDTLARNSVVQIDTPVQTVRTQDPAPSSRAVWYTEHEVKENETIDSITEQYGVSRETILSVNAIKNLSSVQPGVILRIPDRNGQLYTVQSGDSLSIITNRFNPSLGWKTLQEINGLKSEVIYPGQKLFIPSAQVEDDGSFAYYDRFVRPAEGRITGLYGQTVVYGNSEEIVVLQGIWIEGPAESPVKASATGVVVDAGNNPEGMGRFVVLSHEDGYRTSYAHLDQISVKVGDPVRQGDAIGIMGSTGSIGKRALYFSIEQDGTALNPANFF